MRIEQVTKYRCDGCRAEQANPIGWCSLMPMMAGGMTMTVGGAVSGAISSDYCPECIKIMRSAVAVSLQK